MNQRNKTKKQGLSKGLMMICAMLSLFIMNACADGNTSKEKTTVKIEVQDSTTEKVTESRFVREYNADSKNKQPLMIQIFNGKEIELTQKQVTELNSEDIKSIEVLKDEMAEQKYPQRGKNGVVIITMKETE